MSAPLTAETASGAAQPVQRDHHHDDRNQLHRLWIEHRRWIAAVLLAHKPRFADLDDLLQDVATTLVAKNATVRDQANIRGWLRTVALNVARAAARSGKLRPVATDATTIDATNASHGHSFEQHDHQQHVMRLMHELPDTYREPLLLKVQGLRTRQIAEILGIQEAAVDTRISRARKMLRQLLEGESIEVDGSPQLHVNGTARKFPCLSEVRND